ncbi:MAG: two pore domain potassium channel family protein [Deltaproteobacteria bacterium]|nr:two pore domain potassium channel family protein [Deltaproteobacteria bacterium]
MPGTAYGLIPAYDQNKTGMSNNQLLAASTGFLRGRFSILLIAFFVLFLLQMLLADFPLTHYSIPAVLLVALLASVSAFSDNRGGSLLVSVLGVVALAFRWATYVSESYVLQFISDSMGVLFFALIAVLILAAVLREHTVTGDTISGALCVYFLMALVWAFLFMLVESAHPGSFQITEGKKIAADPNHSLAPPLSVFIYFSLVTLSTVGYGDILPLTTPARGLAALEGVIGQFYLAVLVARLVGLYTARSER